MIIRVKRKVKTLLVFTLSVLYRFRKQNEFSQCSTAPSSILVGWYTQCTIDWKLLRLLPYSLVLAMVMPRWRRRERGCGQLFTCVVETLPFLRWQHCCEVITLDMSCSDLPSRVSVHWTVRDVAVICVHCRYSQRNVPALAFSSRAFRPRFETGLVALLHAVICWKTIIRCIFKVSFSVMVLNSMLCAQPRLWS